MILGPSQYDSDHYEEVLPNVTDEQRRKLKNMTVKESLLYKLKINGFSTEGLEPEEEQSVDDIFAEKRKSVDKDKEKKHVMTVFKQSLHQSVQRSIQAALQR